MYGSKFCPFPPVLSQTHIPLQFQWTLATAASEPVNQVYQLAKTKLRTAIETKLAEFPFVLIDTHGKDLTVSGEPSPAGTPKQSNGAASLAAGASASTAAAPKPKAPPNAVNTETVVVTSNFQASAEDLFSILTDEKRIPIWSRAQAQVGKEIYDIYISLTIFECSRRRRWDRNTRCLEAVSGVSIRASSQGRKLCRHGL